MKPASTDSENSDDELDIELKRYLKIGQTVFNDYLKSPFLRPDFNS